MKTKVIKGRGKIFFYDEKDREKMKKKYPDIEFNKMNNLTFTTTYKGKEQFDVEIQIDDTKIPCSFNKWAWPWKYRSKVELRLHFKNLKKKAITHITGGVQGKLFKFFRYDYEKMQNIHKKKKKGGAKKTFKKEQKKENKEYYKSVKKCRKIKDKKQKIKCYIRCNNKRSKTLKTLEKKYPKEWKEFKNNYGGMGSGSFHESTRLEGTWM